jgi:hypothetical protein
VGMPLYDCAVRTSVVTAAGAMVQLVPPAAAVGTGRMTRLRQVAISNTTATGFPVGLGIATAAAVTPATAGVIHKRSGGSAAATGQDAVAISLVWVTFGTTPTAPTDYVARLWIPGNQLVVWSFNEGEELYVPPATTPLPFCIWNIATGQICDVTLTWEE